MKNLAAKTLPASVFHLADAGLPGRDVAGRETFPVLSGDSFCEEDLEEAAGVYSEGMAAGGQWFFRFGFAQAFSQTGGRVLLCRSPLALGAKEDLSHKMDSIQQA